MSKDKRGRKCKGRHCAWCKPVAYVSLEEMRERLGFPPLGSGMQIARKDGTLWNA